MERTTENCSLIKVNLKAGRGKPTQSSKGCEGYMRRGKLHQKCKQCKLYYDQNKEI